MKREQCPICRTRLAFETKEDDGGWYMRTECGCGYEWVSNGRFESSIRAAIGGYEEWNGLE